MMRYDWGKHKCTCILLSWNKNLHQLRNINPELTLNRERHSSLTKKTNLNSRSALPRAEILETKKLMNAWSVQVVFVNTDPAFISKENPALFLCESAFEHSWESRTHSPDYLRGSPQFTTLMASVVLVRRLTGRGSYGLRIILQERKSSGEVNALRLWALYGTDDALCNAPHPTCKLCTLACLLDWLVGWLVWQMGRMTWYQNSKLTRVPTSIF